MKSWRVCVRGSNPTAGIIFNGVIGLKATTPPRSTLTCEDIEIKNKHGRLKNKTNDADNSLVLLYAREERLHLIVL